MVPLGGDVGSALVPGLHFSPRSCGCKNRMVLKPDWAALFKSAARARDLCVGPLHCLRTTKPHTGCSRVTKFRLQLGLLCEMSWQVLGAAGRVAEAAPLGRTRFGLGAIARTCLALGLEGERSSPCSPPGSDAAGPAARRRCWSWSGRWAGTCWRSPSPCPSRTATTTCASPSTTSPTLSGGASCWPSTR